MCEREATIHACAVELQSAIMVRVGDGEERPNMRDFATEFNETGFTTALGDDYSPPYGKLMEKHLREAASRADAGYDFDQRTFGINPR